MPKPIDMTGKKFGRLTVIERADNDKYGKARWACKCECGNICTVSGDSLRNGHTRSCGCLNNDIVSKTFTKDHTGERFGRLVVISRADDYISPSGIKHVQWLCQCDCGNTTVVGACLLVGGHTKSCGCLHREQIENGTNHTHDGSHDRLYKVYYNMKNRCYNSNSEDYKYYGGRGIKICDEWLDDYANFREWAYSSGYNKDAKKGECTIDRIDVNGNYEPQNCRWVSMSIQSKNRRNVVNKEI